MAATNLHYWEIKIPHITSGHRAIKKILKQTCD